MKLKTDFDIKCSSCNVRSYVKILTGIGYTMYNSENTMDCWTHISRGHSLTDKVYRGCGDEGHTLFTDILDFLVWHFTPEESESEKDLDSMQQKMSELQAQMDKLKEAVEKEEQK